MKENWKNNVKRPLTLVFPIAYSWIASSLSISSQFLPFDFTDLLIGKTIDLYLYQLDNQINRYKKGKQNSKNEFEPVEKVFKWQTNWPTLVSNVGNIYNTIIF